MMHLLITISFGISSAWFAVEVAKWHLWFKELLNAKPFNCSSCMGAWMGYFGYFLPDYALYPLTAMFVSGTLATLLNKYA